MLHAGLLRNILACPMSFFESTPLGRILNRFSKDIDVVDTTIAQNFHVWMHCMLRVITIPIVIGYSTPLFLAVAAPLGIFYFVVQVSTCTDLEFQIAFNISDNESDIFHGTPQHILHFV